MGDAENRVDSIRVRKLNSVSNRTDTFCYFKGAVISSSELGSWSFGFQQLQGMNIDEDLVSRFIRNKNMIFIIRIFKSELSKLESVLSDEPDHSYFFSKPLCVRGVELVRVGPSD